MGNAQPQSVDGVPIRSVEEDAGLDSSATGGNVRITGLNVDVEQALKNAFEEGKKEGQANVKNLMEAVAADTYDNIHQQLAELQSKQTNQAKDLAASIQVKMSSAQLHRKPVCVGEHSALLECMKANPKNLLACDQFIQMYTACSKGLN